MLSRKFTSLIKINGKSILPPVMTEARITEMKKYKNEAIKREENRKTKQTEPDKTLTPSEKPSTNPPNLTSSEFLPETVENDLKMCLKTLKIDTSSDSEVFSPSPEEKSWFSIDDTDEEVIPTPSAIVFDGIGDELIKTSPRTEPRTPLTEVESCASLASTELGKYMDISPEEVNNDHSASGSTCSTVKELTPESKFNKSQSCDVISTEDNVKTPIKKHVRHNSYTLECPSPALTAQVDLYKEKGMIFPHDMSAIRCNSLESTQNSFKKKDLNEYLESVARFPVEDEACASVLPTFEDLLIQHDNYFKHLKSQLIVQYKNQMQDLLKQQQNAGNDFLYRVSEPVAAPRDIIKEICNDAIMKNKFNRVSAVVKGYLTRRLLRSQKVQEIIKTIRDTLEFALNFNKETPVKIGNLTQGEVTLHQRILQQLTSSCHDFHDIFFKLSIVEKMDIISQDRALINEKLNIAKTGDNLLKRNLSTATLKVLERKKVKLQNDFTNALSTHDKNLRSKSAFSLRSKKIRAKSDVHRAVSGKVLSSPRTSSPRHHSRLGSHSSLLPSDRLHHRTARRNLSNIYRQDGSSTFRI